jgi:hypothetical protein
MEITRLRAGLAVLPHMASRETPQNFVMAAQAATQASQFVAMTVETGEELKVL